MSNGTGNGAELANYKDELGELVIRRPARGVLLFVESGYLVGSCADLIIQAQEQELRSAPNLTLFVDGGKLLGYDPPMRTVPTEWLKKHKDKVLAQHMLVTSKIARMGLSVAGLVLGTVIKGYTDKREFDVALRAAVANAGGTSASARPLSFAPRARQARCRRGRAAAQAQGLVARFGVPLSIHDRMAARASSESGAPSFGICPSCLVAQVGLILQSR